MHFGEVCVELLNIGGLGIAPLNRLKEDIILIHLQYIRNIIRITSINNNGISMMVSTASPPISPSTA
jgi:hypothetical protein